MENLPLGYLVREMVIRSLARRLADTLVSNFRRAPHDMAWEKVTGRACLLCLELRLHCQLLLGP